MFPILLALILASPPDNDGFSAQPSSFQPVSEVRRLALARSAGRVCVQGVVTMETGILRSGPSDFYLQDQSGGIVVQARGEIQVPRGAAIKACGTPGLYDNLEPQLEQADLTLLGQGKLPAPRELTINEALDGAAPGELIQVRGTVQRISIGETRDVLWLGPPALRSASTSAGSARIRPSSRRRRPWARMSESPES